MLTCIERIVGGRAKQAHPGVASIVNACSINNVVPPLQCIALHRRCGHANAADTMTAAPEHAVAFARYCLLKTRQTRPRWSSGPGVARLGGPSASARAALLGRAIINNAFCVRTRAIIWPQAYLR